MAQMLDIRQNNNRIRKQENFAEQNNSFIVNRWINDPNAKCIQRILLI